MKLLLMYEAGDEHRERLKRAAPGWGLAVARDLEEARAEIRDADVVLGNRFFFQSVRHARRLRWMQSNSMGVDLILKNLDREPSFLLTSAKGLYDEEVSEHAVALCLALVRGLHRFRDDQRREVWTRRPLGTVSGRNALILGWGGVGRAVARKLAALGARVRGVRREDARDSEGFEVLSGPLWRSALPQTDLLVLALPLTPQTAHLVGEGELRALSRGAFVVNVGRGGTLDQRALVSSLRSGVIQGAALDALDTEPPVPGDPLWSEEGLLLTPHVARSPESEPGRWEALFEENVRRFVAGEPLRNVVDWGRGY